MTTHPPHPASSSSPRLLSKHEWTHHDDPSPPVELTTLFPSSMSSARLLDPEPPPPSPSPSLHRSSSSSTWSSPLSNTVLPPVSTTSSPPTEHKPSSCVCSWPSILLQHRTPRHQGGKNGVVAFLRRHWFLLTLPWVIGLAYLIPYVGQTGGPLRTEYSVKYAAVMVIFFFSGLGLEGSILKAFWVHWKVHVVIQSLSFGLLPLFGFASSQLLGLIPWMDKLLSNGLTVALCMPTTISSNVIMTTNARGNTAVSLINATLGNVLGVFVAPLLIKLYLGNTVSLAFDKIMLEMSFTVLAPLILGQLVRYLFVHYGCTTGITRLPLSFISSIMLLLMVFATFSNTFASKTHFSIFPFLLIFLMVSILLPLSMVLCFVLGKTLFHPPETVSIVYCGSTKTLSLGIPILTLLFPNSAETTLPLLLYHALQLFLGGAVAPWLGRWVKSHETSRSLEDGELI